MSLEIQNSLVSVVTKLCMYLSHQKSFMYLSKEADIAYSEFLDEIENLVYSYNNTSQKKTDTKLNPRKRKIGLSNLNYPGKPKKILASTENMVSQNNKKKVDNTGFIPAIKPTFANVKCSTISMQQQESVIEEGEIAIELDENGETLFRCTECTGTFNTMDDLQNHFITSHEVSLITGDVSGNDSDPQSYNEVEQSDHVYIAETLDNFGHNFTTMTKSKRNKRNRIKAKKYNSDSDSTLVKSPQNKNKDIKFKILDQFKEFMSNLDMKTCKVGPDDKPYQCSLCQNNYQSPQSLKRHLQTHFSKLYECNLCSKKYKRSDSLKFHIMSHLNSKPYECNVCKRAFTRRGTLHDHMRMHTGARPFKCKYCPETFGYRGNRSKHYQKCHSDELEEDG